MKPGQVLCYIFLLAIVVVVSAQNPAKYETRSFVAMQLTNRNIAVI